MKRMEITYLGHAGFCVETEKFILIIDPWLSPHGAFDSAWFQFPCNHHLALFVHEKLFAGHKQRYIYISHEHKDHFDLAFLRSLGTSDFTFIIPHYRRTLLFDEVQKIPNQGIIRCQDAEHVALPGGEVTLYLDDSEMDRDSAIVVTAGGKTFLNLNDCKIYDRVPDIVRDHGPIHVFTAQYSGAVWHPVCYDYPRKTYEAISTRKVIGKFEAVARCIEFLRPELYLTSAGPACFLDPMLRHLNYEKRNIFPRASQFLEYLRKRLKSQAVPAFEPMPGDRYDVLKQTWSYLSKDRVTEENYKSYMLAYEQRYDGFFQSRESNLEAADREDVFSRLSEALRWKLDQLTLRDRVRIPLYFRLSDEPSKMIRVDFQQNVVEFVTSIAEDKYYSIETPAYVIKRVLDGRITWDDFTLSFRMKLSRTPDVYHIVIHGFLMMEPEDVNWFCAKVLDAESNAERALVDAGDRRYSINRFCPHQGADLTQGWIEQDRYLVCPRHRWKYDLQNGGQCTSCDISIRAFEV